MARISFPKMTLGYSGRGRPGFAPEFPVCRTFQQETSDHQRTVVVNLAIAMRVVKWIGKKIASQLGLLF